MKKLLFALPLFFASTVAFGAAKPEVLKVETLKLGSSKFVVTFFGPAEFCDYSGLSIQKDGKKVLSLEKRCGREVKQHGPSVVADGKWVKIVKLGPSPADVYLCFSEEPSNYVYRTTLVTTGDKPLVAFSGEITGNFRDFNGDGLFDLLKDGGHGEPTGKSLSYDPYLVFVQKKAGDKTDFKLNEDLSKKFSAENNFEWHGPKYDESIQVDGRGKPVK